MLLLYGIFSKKSIVFCFVLIKALSVLRGRGAVALLKGAVKGAQGAKSRARRHLCNRQIFVLQKGERVGEAQGVYVVAEIHIKPLAEYVRNVAAAYVQAFRNVRNGDVVKIMPRAVLQNA